MGYKIIKQHFSTIIGILAIITTLYYYRKSRRIKEIKYKIESYNLISDFKGKFENLKIEYDGQEVKTLTVSKVGIWNDGNETIRKDDITNDPLRIEITEENEIVDASVIHITRDPTLLNINLPDKKRVLVNFDFLDSNDGGVIQIIHTGKSNMDLNVVGTIKGARTPKEIKIMTVFAPPQSDNPQVPKLWRIIWWGLLVFFSGYAIYIPFLLFKEGFPISIFGSISIVCLAIVIFIYKGFLSKKVPKGFEIIDRF